MNLNSMAHITGARKQYKGRNTKVSETKLQRVNQNVFPCYNPRLLGSGEHFQNLLYNCVLSILAINLL
jgi:hypothetical protein